MATQPKGSMTKPGRNHVRGIVITALFFPPGAYNCHSLILTVTIWPTRSGKPIQEIPAGLYLQP